MRRQGHVQQAGQVALLVIFSLVVLLGAAGLALDGGLTYYKASKAQQAADAAALSGVVFMPSNYSTSSVSGGRDDAVDRAVDTASEDGFAASGVSVSQVTGHTDELSVTVSFKTDISFLRLLGNKSSTISRTAVAQYQSCIGPHLLNDSASASTVTCTAATTPPSWKIVTSQNANSTSTNVLNSPSCVGTTFCVAVGEAGNNVLAEEWNGSAWSIVPAPMPSGATWVDMWGVSCSSTTFCMMGGYTNGGKPLIEEWNGTAWSITPAPMQGRFDNIEGVSCSSTTFCVAAGNYNASSGTSGEGTLVEQWNGTSWSIVTTPDSSSAWLGGVSCVSSSFCAAAGSSNGGGTPLAIMWNGTSWTQATVPNPTANTAGTSEFSGVSCASTTFCAASGESFINGERSLVEQWNGSSWSVETTPDTSTSAPTDQLENIACGSSTVCFGVGYYTTSSANQTLIEGWEGTSWSLVNSPDTGTTLDNVLIDARCSSSTFCVAVGSASSASSGWPQTLIEMYS